MFLQDLVGVKPLGMPQGPQFHGLPDHRHVDTDLGGRVFEVGGNPVDEKRDVVQQLIGGEDLVRINGDAFDNAFQPMACELTA